MLSYQRIHEEPKGSTLYHIILLQLGFVLFSQQLPSRRDATLKATKNDQVS